MTNERPKLDADTFNVGGVTRTPTTRLSLPGQKPVAPEPPPAEEPVVAPTPEQAGRWLAAKASFDAGDYQAAREQLEQSLDGHHDPVEAVLTYARACLECKEPQAAIQPLLDAIARHERYELFAMLGDAHAMAEDHAAAMQAYRESLRLFPPYADGFVKLGAVHYSTDDLDAAAKAFEAALALDREAAAARFFLALICTERGELDRAMAQLHWIKQKGQTYPQIFHLQAIVHERAGDMQAAIEELRRLEGLNLADAGALARLERLERSLRGPEDEGISPA